MRSKTEAGALSVGELGLVSRIRARASGAYSSGVRLGIGDDCALLRVRAGEDLAVTTDLSIDGRHFRLDWHPPEVVGHRTLARGLSDLAAMGARPVAAFLSLGLPPQLVQNARTRSASWQTLARQTSAWQISWIGRFYDGFLALAEKHKTPLAGGDLAQSPVAVADIVLVGAVRRGRALLRSGARPGDAIYVTGRLGGAAAGLARLAELAASASGSRRRSGRRPSLTIPKRLMASLEPHLHPQPRVAQGLWLAKHGLATAALDLSDGLSTDLNRLCEESRVAAEVEAAAVPVYPGATLEQALNGGEDYELLFTARAGARIPRAIVGVPVTRIGSITDTSGRRRAGKPAAMLLTEHDAQPLEPRGWGHFS